MLSLAQGRRNAIGNAVIAPRRYGAGKRHAVAGIAFAWAVAMPAAPESETQHSGPTATVVAEVIIVGLKKLRRSSHVNAFLVPLDEGADMVRRHVAIVYPASCDIHQNCGSATVVFEAIRSGLEYTLILCHTAHKKLQCTLGDDGHPKEAGVAEVVTISAANSRLVFDLEASY